MTMTNAAGWAAACPTCVVQWLLLGAAVVGGIRGRVRLFGKGDGSLHSAPSTASGFLMQPLGRWAGRGPTVIAIDFGPWKESAIVRMDVAAEFKSQQR